MQTQILKELGFTNGEIKVYFALFDLGTTTVGPISRKAEVTHAKVYPILDKLIEKGLVSHTIKDRVKHFSATNPNSLIEFINKKERDLEQEKTKIKYLIPQLLSKQKSKEQTQYSRVFEGFNGLRALFLELFEANKGKAEICVFGLNELLKKPSFQNFFVFYHEIRKKNNVDLKLILSRNIKSFIDSHYQIIGVKSADYEKNKVKYVNLTFPTGVFIFKDHVINIIADKEVTAFDIKSAQNAERYRKFFYSMWSK